jgi:ankyrin repeat protein
MEKIQALAHKAFHEDDAKALRQLFEENPELKTFVNSPLDGFGGRPIHGVRSKAMLDVLIDAGADLNARSDWKPGGFGILETADPALALYAIEKGAAITVHGAARLGLIEELRVLVASDPELVHQRGGDGKLALHYAATPEIAEFLLQNGAEINARDIDHESTAAQYAVKARPDVARYLIDRGCETDLLMAAALNDHALAERLLAADFEAIRTRVSSEWFPLSGDGAKNGGTIYQWELGWYVSGVQVATNFGHHELATYLTSRSPAEERFLNACWLHQQAEPPPTFTPAGQRHLAHAARNNDLLAFRLFLDAGLPLDARSQHRATPLHWAAFHGNADMVGLLLSSGADRNNTDNDYSGTPLNWAQHGSEHGWYPQTGDYARTMSLLQAA